VPAIAAMKAAPKAQKGAFIGRAGDAAHDVVVVFTAAVPLHSFPLQEPLALAWIFTSSTPLSAVTHGSTSLAFTKLPLQKIAPTEV
jgi:hypothetical protein